VIKSASLKSASCSCATAGYQPPRSLRGNPGDF
jgi:hypothetical protein